MASFQIEWKASALKELEKLPKQIIPRIITTVEGLAEKPYPPGVRKLANTEFTFRIRVGDYRVVYDVVKTRLIVQIIRVRHRKDVYK